MIGTFGNIVFETSDRKCLTPEGITRTAGSKWTTHDVIGGKAKAEYLGAELRGFSFELLLRATLGVKPRKSLERLAKLAEGKEVYPLVIGGVPVSRGKMRLVSVSETWGEMYSGGELISARVSCSFEEYM